eukprot:255723-Chlamydomonas_euryale.AAC.1
MPRRWLAAAALRMERLCHFPPSGMPPAAIPTAPGIQHPPSPLCVSSSGVSPFCHHRPTIPPLPSPHWHPPLASPTRPFSPSDTLPLSLPRLTSVH